MEQLKKRVYKKCLEKTSKFSALKSIYKTRNKVISTVEKLIALQNRAEQCCDLGHRIEVLNECEMRPNNYGQ